MDKYIGTFELVVDKDDEFLAYAKEAGMAKPVTKSLSDKDRRITFVGMSDGSYLLQGSSHQTSVIRFKLNQPLEVADYVGQTTKLLFALDYSGALLETGKSAGRHYTARRVIDGQNMVVEATIHSGPGAGSFRRYYRRLWTCGGFFRSKVNRSQNKNNSTTQSRYELP